MINTSIRGTSYWSNVTPFCAHSGSSPHGNVR
jgi:hypothetical protein